MEAMETYFRATEPAIHWARLNQDIEFASDGRAVFTPTGEFMEVQRQLEGPDGEPYSETVPVKRRVEPDEPETFTVETFENSPLQEGD